MSRVPVNGVNLNVEVTGSGPPVLALHGFIGNLSTWTQFANEAQSEYTIVLVDLLGHGASDCPDDPRRYGIERSVADLVAILDHLGLDRACWLGYSMGGRIALMAATLVPERCAAIVLEGASPGLADPEERAQRAQRDEALARSIEEEGLDQFVDYWERLPLFASQTRLSPKVRQSLRKQRLGNNPRGLAHTLRGAGAGVQPPVHEQLPHITIPVLCLIGEEDTKFRAIAEAMYRELPDGRISVIASAGHAPHLERPELFNRVVLDFLCRLRPWDDVVSMAADRRDSQSPT